MKNAKQDAQELRTWRRIKAFWPVYLAVAFFLLVFSALAQIDDNGVVKLKINTGPNAGVEHWSSTEYSTIVGAANVFDLIGTTNQVNVSAGIDVLRTNNVTLTLPQEIHTGANVTFATVTTTLDVNVGQFIIGPGADGDLDLFSEGSYLVVFDSNNNEAGKVFVLAVGTGGIPDGIFVVDQGGTTTIDGAIRADGTIDSYVLGQFGVGLSSPTVQLFVLVSGSAVTPDGGTDLLIQDNSAGGSDAIAAIVGGNAAGGTAELTFGDGDDQDVASIRLLNVNNRLLFDVLGEVMRLTDNQDVGIGETNPTRRLQAKDNVASNYTALIQNDGNATTRWGLAVQAGEDTAVGSNVIYAGLDGNGTLIGTITWDGVTFQVNTISDRNEKRNIRPTILEAAPVISSIEVVDFDPIDYPATAPAQFRGRGFIADDLELVYPKAVTTNEDGRKMIGNAALVPLLVKGAQELQERVTALERLEARINAVENEIRLGRNR